MAARARLSGRPLLLLALLFAGGVRAAAQDAPAILTLQAAVGEALAHNERLVNSDDALELAELSVEQARNAFQPKLVPNIQGSFGQTNVSNQNYRVDLSQRLVTGTEFRVGVGASTSQIPSLDGSAGDVRFYNADTTLTLTQPLLRGFGRAVTRRHLTTAEARRVDAGRQRTIAEQQLTVEVARAYYQLVSQRALVGVAEVSLRRAQALLSAAEAKLEAGLVSQLDVLRARSLVTETEGRMLDARGGAEDDRDLLCYLIGRASCEGLEVDATIPKRIDTLTAAEAAAVALERRLDLASAISAVDEADRSVTFARNQLLPQVDVNLALTRRETAPSLAKSFGVDHLQGAMFFTISMPVDRTPQKVEFQNAVIDQARRRRDLETLRRRIGDDVRRVVRNRDRVLRTLESTETGVSIAEQEVEVARLRSERGLSNNLDVVAAEGALLAMQSRRLSALADLAVAHLSLRAAMGVLDPRNDVGTTAAEPADLRRHPLRQPQR